MADIISEPVSPVTSSGDRSSLDFPTYESSTDEEGPDVELHSIQTGESNSTDMDLRQLPALEPHEEGRRGDGKRVCNEFTLRLLWMVFILPFLL